MLSEKPNLSLPLDFSLYQLIDQSSIYNIFMETTPMLAHWCQLIEQMIIDEAIPATVYVGFQKFSRFHRVLPRYQVMVSVGASSIVMSEMEKPVPEMDGITLVPISGAHLLCKEWFIVVNHPLCTRALFARETTPPGTPRTARLYEGVLTSDPILIAEAEAALVDALGGAG